MQIFQRGQTNFFRYDMEGKKTNNFILPMIFDITTFLDANYYQRLVPCVKLKVKSYRCDFVIKLRVQGQHTLTSVGG